MEKEKSFTEKLFEKSDPKLILKKFLGLKDEDELILPDWENGQ